MQRGLQLRGSNSVCGRFIQKDNAIKNNTTEPPYRLYDEHSPLKKGMGDSISVPFALKIGKPMMKIVRVLDLKDSSKQQNKEVYL